MPIRQGRAYPVHFVTDRLIAYTGAGANESYPWTITGGLEVITGPDFNDVVFVSKDGNNDNSGLRQGAPVQTIDRAITIATSLGPAQDNQIAIQILDAKEYAESFVQPDYTHLYGNTATVYGEIEVGDACELRLFRARATANNQTIITKAAGNQHSYIFVSELDGTGAVSGAASGSGSLTGVRCVFNNIGTGISINHIPVLIVGENGEGVASSEVGFGHLHYYGNDVYGGGDNAVLFAGNIVNSSIVVMIDHMKTLNGATNVTGFFIGSSGDVFAVAAEIDVQVPWNMGGAGNTRDLHLICPNVTGSPVGTPTTIVCNQMLRLPNLPTSPGAPGTVYNNGGVLTVSP